MWAVAPKEKKVLRPHKTTGKIIVLCILYFNLYVFRQMRGQMFWTENPYPFKMNSETDVNLSDIKWTWMWNPRTARPLSCTRQHNTKMYASPAPCPIAAPQCWRCVTIFVSPRLSVSCSYHWKSDDNIKWDPLFHDTYGEFIYSVCHLV
jgi:hypothetical protein